MEPLQAIRERGPRNIELCALGKASPTELDFNGWHNRLQFYTVIPIEFMRLVNRLLLSICRVIDIGEMVETMDRRLGKT